MKVRYRAVLGIIFVACCWISTKPAEASHFRFMQIQCTPTGTPGEIECFVKQAWRRSAFGGSGSDGLVVPGDSNIGESNLNWGDGATDPIFGNLTVTQISIAQDYAIAEGTFTHQYSSPGTYTIFFTSCCRIGALLNRANESELVSAVVKPFSNNATPRTSISPIVGYPQSSTAGNPVNFAIPISDPEGDPLSCRFATNTEAGTFGGNPPGLSISSNCVLSWDNASLAQGLWTTQVIVEQLNNQGQVQQSTPIDFILELGVQGSNTPPECTINPAGPLTVSLGAPVSFTVTGTDSDAGDVVEIAGVTVPGFGSMTPGLPVSAAASVSSTFNGTAPSSPGTFFATYSVSDTKSISQCNLRIDVIQSQGDITAPVCRLQAVNPGPPTNIEILVQDGESGLKSIQVLKDRNADVTWPTFTDGTTDPLIVTGTKINEGQRASVVIKVTDVAGNSTTCDPVIETVSAEVPDRFVLEGNFPNPFNPTTMIPFKLAESAHVTLKVYDLTGREVATLVNAPMDAGSYQAEWDGRDGSGQILPSGIYMYRIQAGSFSESKTMTLIK